jgi:hypothetical protein
MQTSNAKQHFRSDDPAWILLAELPLRDFLSDLDWKDESTTGYLFQTARELGMSPECMENIAGTVTKFAKEALVRYKQEGPEFPGRIRIFCQKKIIDSANSAKTSRPCQTEQTMKQSQIFSDSGANTVGGWGYFMIERGENLPRYSSAIPHNYIGLYLYKEGE